MSFTLRFRFRSPDRDCETDTRRFGQLLGQLELAAAAILSERDGLEKRYRSAMDDAAFMAEALENDEAPPSQSIRIDELTRSIMNCQERLKLLSDQLELIDELTRSLRMFRAERLELPHAGRSAEIARQLVASGAGEGS